MTGLLVVIMGASQGVILIPKLLSSLLINYGLLYLRDAGSLQWWKIHWALKFLIKSSAGFFQHVIHNRVL